MQYIKRIHNILGHKYVSRQTLIPRIHNDFTEHIFFSPSKKKPEILQWTDRDIWFPQLWEESCISHLGLSTQGLGISESSECPSRMTKSLAEPEKSGQVKVMGDLGLRHDSGAPLGQIILMWLASSFCTKERRRLIQNYWYLRPHFPIIKGSKSLGSC